MSTYALIKNGAVINLVLWDGETFNLNDGEVLVPATEGAAIGGTWDGATFTPPAPPLPPAPAVPAQVTMRQARLALLGAGKLDEVESAIAALPSPQKEAAQIEWEYSQSVQRDRGLVVTIGVALGLTEADIDALFITAAGL